MSNNGKNPFQTNPVSELLGTSDLKTFKRTLLILCPIIVLGTVVGWYRDQNKPSEEEILRREDLKLAREQEEKRRQLYANNPAARVVIEEARKKAQN